jgi:hypothetical protein
VSRLAPAALLVAILPAAASAGTTPPAWRLAYSAEKVSVVAGVTSHGHEWSDGVRWKFMSDDGSTGGYRDPEKKLLWQWGKGYACLQMPLADGTGTPPPKEEELGRETVDGHATRKLKVTYTFRDPKGAAVSAVSYEWRATDLQDLVIQYSNEDGSTKTHLRNIVLGKPDPAKLAFPSPQCKYDPSQDTTRYAAEAAGGYRTIAFFDAGCKQFVPLPLEMTIPSDYAIRAARPHGCFWGAEEDLDRVLASPSEVDFTAHHRGVYWCRPSQDTEYDPVRKKFVNAAGPQENWPAAFAAQGVKDLVMMPKSVGGIATLRVSGSLNGKRVYMLYLGFGDSPAVLISYTPPAPGAKGDAAEWARFLESLRAAR